MTYNMLMGTLNPTHSLTHSLFSVWSHCWTLLNLMFDAVGDRSDRSAYGPVQPRLCCAAFNARKEGLQQIFCAGSNKKWLHQQGNVDHYNGFVAHFIAVFNPWVLWRCWLVTGTASRLKILNEQSLKNKFFKDFGRIGLSLKCWTQTENGDGMVTV